MPPAVRTLGTDPSSHAKQEAALALREWLLGWDLGPWWGQGRRVVFCALGAGHLTHQGGEPRAQAPPAAPAPRLTASAGARGSLRARP